MYQANMEEKLLALQPELYLNIKQKSVENLNLSIKIGTTTVKFGKVLDFHLFWISEKRKNIYFIARKKPEHSKKKNLTWIKFINSNQEAIFKEIDEIYSSYSDALTNGSLQEEAKKIEEKKALRAIIANNQKAPPAIQLLWNDVTVSSFEVLEHSCHDHDTITLDKIAQLESYGHCVSELFDDILCTMESKYYNSLSHKLSIYREHIESDKKTLADIASGYDVSRERIRQLVKQIDDRLFGCFKRALLFDDTELNEYVEQLASIFREIDYRLTNLIAYGLAEYSNRRKKAIFTMLFGNSFSQKLMEEVQPLSKKLKEQSDLRQKNEELLQAWEFYQSKICYPSHFTADPSLCVSSYEQELSYSLGKRFYETLKKFETIIDIVKNPDIVYYSTSKTNHRPHLLLRLPNKTIVLAIVLPTVNMALIYNIQRCNELHRFCKEHGYGYLIMDDRGNSIYDIKTTVLDPELVDRFNDILNKQTMITWTHIKGIKLTQSVSNIDIAAYVLQNKLHFTLDPFCIKQRKTTYI